MALGTPVAGVVAYSSSGGTTITPAYPSGIGAGDVLALIVGMKPSTANGGTLSSLSGWTVRDSLTAAGGYGTTLGADEGNTNLWILTKDTVAGTETGNLTVTVGTNNISWACIVLIPKDTGAVAYGFADGSRTTAPTVNVAYTVTLTNGSTATNFQNGDVALWAMCIPTDVTTPSQFSAHTISATGATFGTPAELREADSQTGNDIGGYIAYATVTAGSSTAAPTVGATAAGTVTNVRGPIVLLRIRETVNGSLSATETGTDTFSGSGKVIVSGSLSATETGTDTFSGSGNVISGISGSMAATETGTDAFAGSGKVIITGSLAATETGSDTFAGSGKVIVTGSLAATETESDTFAGTGSVLVSGSMSATEVGADEFSASGFITEPPVVGSMAAVEVGDDTFAGSGAVLVSGSMAATEVGDDTFSGTGSVLVSGSLAATEVGDDTFLASGTVTDTVTGSMAAVEVGNDTFSAQGEVRTGITGSMAATEAGADQLGGYVLDGYVASGYVETGIFGTVKKVYGGGFVAFSSRTELAKAADKLLGFLEDPVVKKTPKLKKIIKRLESVEKPSEKTLVQVAEEAIVALEAQERLSQFMVEIRQLRQIIENLEQIKRQMEEEDEESLLLLM